MRRSRRGWLALLVAAAACDAPTVPGEAPAYDPTTLTAGRVYHWPLGRTIAVHVHADDAGEAAALRAQVLAASAAWTSALRYAELAVRLVDRAEEADVVVGLGTAGHPVALDACGGFGIAAGFTLLCPAAGDTARTLPLRSGAPSRVKVAVVVDPAATPTAERRAAVVAHELGHAFGVGGHSGDVEDVMHVEPRVPAPSARDAGTLRYVLHRPAAIRL